MTQQELIQNIKLKNPQFNHLSDEVLINLAIKQKPELKNQISDYGVKTAKEERAEKAKQLINDLQPQTTYLSDMEEKKEGGAYNIAKNVGIGFLKGAARTVDNLAKPLQRFGEEKIAKKILPQKIYEGVKNINQKYSEDIQAKNTAQKVGGYVELAAETLIPATKVVKAVSKAPKAIKALTLSEKELKNIPKKVFEKIFNVNKKDLKHLS